MIVILALLWEVAAGRRLGGARAPPRAPARVIPVDGYDPGRERRAEQRARQLLRSCVNDEEWAMYRDLGLHPRLGRAWPAAPRARRRRRATRRAGAPYAYLIYPHKPIVAYLPQTRELLNEYCVDVPRRDAALRQRAAARLRRRARQVDGAHRRRASA